MTVIRKGNCTDIPAIISMARDMHAESPRYRTLGFDAEKINALALGLILNPEAGGVLVAEQNGYLVGMLAFYVSEFFFGGDLLASDLVMYVRPQFRGGSIFPRLVVAFEKWADEFGVKEKQLGVSAGIDSERVVDVLKRMGYAPVAIGTMKK